jgi:hypothetical protein
MTGGFQRPEVNPPADRARNADATPVALPWSGDRTKGSRGRPVTRSPAAGWWATRNLDSDGLTQPGVAELFPSRLRLIIGGILTGRSRGARRLVGREWFCSIRRRRRRARLAPNPILQVGGGRAGGQDGEGLGPEELPPRRSAPPGHGPRPPRRSTFAIVVAEILIPSWRSSPLILR